MADTTPDSEVFRDEVFGPVLAVTPFDTDDEAIALANDTVYGLASSVWTRDVYRSLRATREIRAGVVWVNDHIPIVSEMPHGGMGQSGYGKDMSMCSLDEYTVVKHVMYDLTADKAKAWHRTIFALAPRPHPPTGCARATRVFLVIFVLLCHFEEGTKEAARFRESGPLTSCFAGTSESDSQKSQFWPA